MSTKRILSLVLALVMVLGTFGTVFAAESTGSEKIDWLVEQGIVKGNEKGELLLDKTIDRASVAKMVVEALNHQVAAAGMQGIKSVFTDVPANHWSNGNINVVHGLGLMIGNNGKFMPSENISYNEVITILVRMVPNGITAEEEKTAVWPATYIAKANQLGLLEGLTATNYAANAIRKDILELFYNAMMNMEVGNYSIVKGIVLENNRVEALDKDEVVVEIIKEVQRANYVEDSRYERGDQENFVIDAKVGDVENLLGKVADFTLDKNGKVVKVAVDETYKVIEGPITEATKGKIEMDRAYTVELDERYKEKDDRIFRTYHNDKAYAYEDFYKEVKEADYARVTVKNGKVLFIDAFTFDDIAPVQEVKRDGQDVYVYNDYRDARVEKFEPRTLVVAYNDGKFSRMEREDIKVNDVVHVYAKNRMIVRQDALVEGTYQKVERDRNNNYFVHLDDSKYYIGNKDYFRPVYAHDSKAYTTLFTQYAQTDLANFYKEKVTILVDINGDLQLFGADVEYNEGMAMIEQILARGQVKFVQPNDERLVLDEDYDSDISISVDGKTTTNQRLNAFNTRDLVFVLGAEDKIDTLVRIKTEAEMRKAAQELNSVKAADMNDSYIRMKDNYRYQVLDRTNVFVIKGNGSIVGTTVAKLQAALKAGTTVEAFVLSDAEVTKLIEDKVIYDRNRITNKIDIAHTIVFLDPEYAVGKTDGETVLVTNIYTARTPHYVVGQRPGRVDERTVERTAATGVKLNTLNVNDIVSLKLTKDDDKLVKDFEVLISASKVKTDSYRVVGGDFSSYSRYEFRRLYLQDAEQEKAYINDLKDNPRLDPTNSKYSDEYWLVRDVEEFGTITMDSVVTFHLDGKDIDVIRVYPKNTEVTANAKEDNGEELTGVVTYINPVATEFTILLDGSKVYTINANTILKDSTGVLGMGTTVKALLAEGDIVKLEGDVITRTSSAHVEANKVIAKIAALPAAGAVALTDEAAIVAARTAYNALTDGAKVLVDLAVTDNTTRLETLETELAGLKAAAVDAQKAAAVDTKILALPATITLANKAAVVDARAAYNALTTTQRGLVAQLAVLTAAETKITDLENLAAAKAALTTLTFDTTNNSTSAAPVIKEPVAHANGATYAFTTITLPTPAPATGNAAMSGNDVQITRDNAANFTFELEVTITAGSETGTVVFNIAVPTTLDAVTVVAQ